MPEYLTLTGSPRLYIGKTQAHLMQLGLSTILFWGRGRNQFVGLEGGINSPFLLTFIGSKVNVICLRSDAQCVALINWDRLSWMNFYLHRPWLTSLANSSPPPPARSSICTVLLICERQIYLSSLYLLSSHSIISFPPCASICEGWLVNLSLKKFFIS